MKTTNEKAVELLEDVLKPGMLSREGWMGHSAMICLCIYQAAMLRGFSDYEHANNVIVKEISKRIEGYVTFTQYYKYKLGNTDAMWEELQVKRLELVQKLINYYKGKE